MDDFKGLESLMFKVSNLPLSKYGRKYSGDPAHFVNRFLRCNIYNHEEDASYSHIKFILNDVDTMKVYCKEEIQQFRNNDLFIRYI